MEIGRGRMKTSELLGKEVLDKNGDGVGKVVDLEINYPQWTINHIVLRLGMIKKVPIGIDKIDKLGDKIILKITKDELEKL
jgi:sporulation protein YlmC with PRC-barrel domain